MPIRNTKIAIIQPNRLIQTPPRFSVAVYEARPEIMNPKKLLQEAHLEKRTIPTKLVWPFFGEYGDFSDDCNFAVDLPILNGYNKIGEN